MSHPVPGQHPGVFVSPRDVLLSYNGLRYGRGVLDAARATDGTNTGHEDELRPGTPLAQITTTRLWVPCKRTTASATVADSTALAVVDARAFKPGDSIKVGSNPAQPIVAVDYASHTLTLTSQISWAADDAVVTEDGSQTPRAILNEFVKLRDDDGVLRNKLFGQAVIAGLVDPHQLLGDAAAVRTAADSKLSFIQWGDDAGLV